MYYFILTSCFGARTASDPLPSKTLMILELAIIVVIILIFFFAFQYAKKLQREKKRKEELEFEKEKQKIIHYYDTAEKRDLAVELKKYQSLYVKGLISEEEYQEKRKQLLGLK